MITRNNLTTATAPIEREIVMSRLFHVPPELVFKAYIDPNLIPQCGARKDLRLLLSRWM